MHYAFDRWMDIHFPGIPFERYADNVIVHTRTETGVVRTLSALKERFRTCHLELHPTKTKIVYCKDKDRRADYPNTEFDFLGYTFRRLFIKDRLGRLRFNFLPAVSRRSCVSFRHRIKSKPPVLRGGFDCNYFNTWQINSFKTYRDLISYKR
jgi:hypothetical protein